MSRFSSPTAPRSTEPSPLPPRLGIRGNSTISSCLCTPDGTPTRHTARSQREDPPLTRARYGAFARVLAATRAVLVPDDWRGGGERAVLEARACGVPHVEARRSAGSITVRVPRPSKTTRRGALLYLARERDGDDDDARANERERKREVEVCSRFA